MSKRHISYPKIGQLRNVISNVCHMATYVGLDENGEPKYDGNLPRPVLKFTGTIKLHGTNASVSWNNLNGLWFQSRKNIITPEKDNAGFAFFAESQRGKMLEFVDEIVGKYDINGNKYTVSIYGEWCGGNIQKGVAITGLDKMWVIFGVKISAIDTDSDEASYWVDHSSLKDNDNRIYNIDDFPKYEVDIDFTAPSEAQNKIVEMVLAVEKECPVGKAFDVSGIGEGIVFTSEYKDTRLRFKAKGKEHSASKVKTVAPIDIEKLNSTNEFIEYAVTENRLNQAVEQVFTSNGTTPEIKMMGQFLKWITNDIVDEEMDVMTESNLEPRDVKKYISNKARLWFMNYLDKQAGLA